MSDASGATIEVKVTRYNIARLRLAMVLVPVAILVTTAARHAQTTALFIVAAFVQIMALVGFIAAVKRLGSQPLVLIDGVSFGESGFRIARMQVRKWTLVGRVARLYARDVSYKVVVQSGGESVLRALLSSQFGQPTALERRGSKRARFTALAIAVFGLVVTVYATTYDSGPLAFLGAPAALIGIGTYSVLSERAAIR